MVKRDIKKYLVYLICLVLIIVQTGFAAFASGDISVSDINEEGLVTISGNISSGAGKPVAILVVNTSVDAGTDRLGGIRMSDSCVSGEKMLKGVHRSVSEIISAVWDLYADIVSDHVTVNAGNIDSGCNIIVVDGEGSYT